MKSKNTSIQHVGMACGCDSCSKEQAGHEKGADLARRNFLCSTIGGTAAVVVHGSCGAVKATIEGKAVPGQISALYTPIRPAVDAAGPDLDVAIDANAKIQATLLSQASPIIAGAIKEGNLKVVAARYDIVRGRVSLLA